MPACVIKCCTNATGRKRKPDGVTFHRIKNKHNEWTNRLIEVIRKCRLQSDWNPSETSVICSIHFDANDFVTTKNGHPRLVCNTLPKKFLLEPSYHQREEMVLTNACDTLQKNSSVPQATAEVEIEQPHTSEDPNYRSTSIAFSPELQAEVEIEQPHTSEDPNYRSTSIAFSPELQLDPTSSHIEETHFSSPLSTIVLEKSSSMPTAPGANKGPSLLGSEAQCDSFHSSLLLQQNPDKGEEALGSDIDIEKPLSVLYTPRKRRLKENITKKEIIIRKLRQKLRTANQKIKRLHSRNESLKDIVKKMKENNLIDTDLFGKLNEDIIAVNLFNNYNRKKLKKNVKYSPVIKKFCLTLNYYSPKAYDYVRNTFDTCLPHRRTLSKWYGNLKGDPGFTEESFQALKAKSQVSQRRPLCSLVFDEVAIRPQPIWEGKKNIGLEDMGTGPKEGAPLASQALVFLIVGINSRFKLPVGYFLSNSFTADQKSNLVKLCLTKCFESDIDVISLTCDGHATNLNALQLLGCNFNTDNIKTIFPHPSNTSSVACFLDPSHVMKLLRNTWHSKKVITDGNGSKIQWFHLEKLNNLQNEEGLHLANKISNRHLHFQNNKMKVKLATQVFSTSVATALRTCREVLKLDEFQHSEATESFIQKINDMFDVFNSRTMSDFDYKKALCIHNKDLIFTFLDELKEYILNLKINHRTKRKVTVNGRVKFLITRYFQPIVAAQCKTGFIGTIINIESLKYLYEDLIQNKKQLVYLPTYKLSQDHLEMFFSSLRMQGGFNDNPNVRQFKGNYRKLLARLEISCMTTGNCVPMEQIAILNCTSTKQIINSTTPSYRYRDDEDVTCDTLNFMQEIPKEASDLARRLDVEELNDYRKLIIGYLAGSIAHYAIKKLKCQRCTARLSCDERLYFHKLINLKNRGGLQFPSADLYDVCCICELIVRKVSKENIKIYNEKQYEYILTKIQEKFIGSDKVFQNLEGEHTFAGVEHKISLIKFIAEKYLSIRFHHISKLEYVARTYLSRRQQFRKIIQHTGL